MADQYTDQEFVEYVARAIVNHPADVKTERTVDERGVLITLHINAEDMGYVIGREGQTARAMRTLLRIVGAKNNARVNLKIYEPEGSRGPRAPRMGGSMGGNMGSGMGGPNAPSSADLDDIKL
ncbi:MAG: KH domain-containing protein [bacterium]|nr:KH domain-containing protein [bacterium]